MDETDMRDAPAISVYENYREKRRAFYEESVVPLLEDDLPSLSQMEDPTNDE